MDLTRQRMRRFHLEDLSRGEPTQASRGRQSICGRQTVEAVSKTRHADLRAQPWGPSSDPGCPRGDAHPHPPNSPTTVIASVTHTAAPRVIQMPTLAMSRMEK